MGGFECLPASLPAEDSASVLPSPPPRPVSSCILYPYGADGFGFFSLPQMTMSAEEVLANGNTNLIYTYPGMTKTMRSKTGKQFKLHVEEGQFADSEILVLLGK